MPLVTSQPSPLETNFNDWMQNVFGAHGWGRGAFRPTPQLNNLAGGRIPPIIQQQWQQNLDRNLAATRESFGRAGARFGTDLSTSLGREAGAAATDLGAQAMQNVINANLARANMASPLLNTSSGLINTSFQRQENALTRALQEFLASQEGGGLDALIPLLLQLMAR